MVDSMIMKLRMRISRGGQISIPAAIRHRWGTSTVSLQDLGDRLVIEPAADDPVAAAEGALAREVPAFDERKLRARARADERAAASGRR
jgi:hypothetical protein